MMFAKEIHLVHRRDAFNADASLVNDAKKAKNVTFHTNMVVGEFLGNDKLTGVRLRSTTGKKTKDLHVDGVFLEIGLTANTDPIKDFIELNEKGEIPVQQDNATSISGFFAAGDVTDVPEKQIVVAAGEGAKAALSTYKYLIGKKLIAGKAMPDAWE
jgi:alkyl hydroperoxide reductase subunit F